jgi:hypothetical protein
LDELARKNQELAERSKNRRHDYKLVGSDIIKTDPEPLPTHFKEQIREMLESRISTDTSSINQQDRSGYVTDASSATWQFNNSFSPRSVVSLNGAKAEDVSGLLKVRTTTAPPEVCLKNTLQLFGRWCFYHKITIWLLQIYYISLSQMLIFSPFFTNTFWERLKTEFFLKF